MFLALLWVEPTSVEKSSELTSVRMSNCSVSLAAASTRRLVGQRTSWEVTAKQVWSLCIALHLNVIEELLQVPVWSLSRHLSMFVVFMLICKLVRARYPGRQSRAPLLTSSISILQR